MCLLPCLPTLGGTNLLSSATDQELNFGPTASSPKPATCGPGLLLLQQWPSLPQRHPVLPGAPSLQQGHGRSAAGLQGTSPLGRWRMGRAVPGVGHMSPAAYVLIPPALSLWA